MSNYDFDSLTDKIEKLSQDMDELNWKMERILETPTINESVLNDSFFKDKLPTLNLTPKQMRVKVMMKISGEMECINCGCDDTRILEINHKNGDGKKDRDTHRFYKRILLGIRKVDDLELVCKVCNWLHFVQFKYGIKGHKIVFDPYEP